MTHASLATVEELFRYKAQGFELPPFPGYTTDQWGIKAHNRPWIVEIGDWEKGQRVIEVGGAYSRLPEWLGSEYGVEPWIGDDFGEADGETDMWSRWGDPKELPGQFPSVTYAYENFGKFSPTYPDQHFDWIFSVSTLEHIPVTARLDVLKDMNRCTAKGGKQLHTIDIIRPGPKQVAVAAVAEKVGLSKVLARAYTGGIAAWFNRFSAAGIKIEVEQPSSLELLKTSTLVESADVIFRFVPPNNQPKPYTPVASLLVVIEDR